MLSHAHCPLRPQMQLGGETRSSASPAHVHVHAHAHVWLRGIAREYVLLSVTERRQATVSDAKHQ